jgi:hypothetical protein
MAGLNVTGGTVVMGPAGTTVEWAAAGAPADGQRESGDVHVVRESKDELLLAVVDALGHGIDAARVAAVAATAIEAGATGSLVTTIHQCHRALTGTRGAVAATARFDSTGSLSWLSVGNVTMTLLRRRFGRLRVSAVAPNHPGIIGLRLPALREASFTLRPGDLVVISTDGIRASITSDIAPSPDLSNAIVHLVEGGRIESDDGLVLAARYLGARG